MQYIGRFMKYFTDPVSTILPHDCEAVFLGMFLYGCSNIAQMRARSDLFYTEKHAFMGDFDQPLGQYRRFADEKHFTGVTMVTVFQYGDINIDNVAVLKLSGPGDAMAYLVID